MILTEHLQRNLSKTSGKAALRYLGKDLSYKNLLTQVSRLSYLYQNELGTQVRMAFFCRNSPAYVMTFLAMTHIRAVSIPLNPEALPSELLSAIKESKATHLAVTSDLIHLARELLNSERINIPIIDIEKKKGGEYHTSFTPAPDQTPKETDTILLLRSSGYSTKPKFAAFSHRQLLHAAAATRKHYHFLPNDKFHTLLPWSLPFSFVHALLIPLLGGATCLIDHGLEATELLNFLTESHVTRIVGTPAFFLKFLVTCKNEKKVLPSLKSVIVGYGTLPPDIQKTFDMLQVPISHCYGQVENLWTIAMQDTQTPEQLPVGYKKGFVGKGLAGLKYKVIDKNGDEITPEDQRVGQLALSGPTVMQGYPGYEKETRSALRGSWLYTGDYVQLDGEGEELTFTFLGRKEDMQEQDLTATSLDEIDLVMKRHSTVQDAASFYLKDAKNKRVLVCVVVKVTGSLLTENQFLEYLHAHVPSDVMPQAMAFTDEIPRDLGNNVHYAKLRGRFSGMIG